jgi:Zn-dependent protease with chaperone function
LFSTLLFVIPADAAILSRSTEISMGREAAQEYERAESIDADPVLAARVRRIGNRLIAVCDATQYPFEFHEVETNEINAFALPGGFVYFFRGLAQLMPGDDALAFIMAHEISHVTQRHGVKQLEKSMAIGAVLSYTLTPGVGANLLHLVIDMHYSRHDEAEADRLGLALMAKAGFDPSQGVEAMQVIARIGKSDHRIPGLLRSHPLPESRIAALKREAAVLHAAPRPAPRVAAAPPLPAPVDPPPAPAPASASDLFPLTVGMSWRYRVAGPAGAETGENPPISTTSVVEQQPDHPGLFRLRTELDDGLAWTRLVTVASGGVFTL